MKNHRFLPSAKFFSLSLVAAASLAVGNSARAALAFTLTETGSGVTLAGTGSFNFGGSLNNLPSTMVEPLIWPNSFLGAATVGPIVVGYDSAPSAIDPGGSPSFGPGFGSPGVTTSSGDTFGFIVVTEEVLLPTGYTTGSPLSGQVFWSGATLASLEATPGSYAWNTTFGGVNDTITLNVVAVPEPAAAGLSLLALGLFARRRRA